MIKTHTQKQQTTKQTNKQTYQTKHKQSNKQTYQTKQKT